MPEAGTRRTLSVALIAFNEEQNLPRTLASISWADEIIVVDSGSTDQTAALARAAGAHVLVQPWLGFAAQKNYALEHCRGDWILSLDADEAVSDRLAGEIRQLLQSRPEHDGFLIPRRNYFLGRAMLHGGFYPDPKLRLFRRGRAAFAPRSVHETMRLEGAAGRLTGELLHRAYPTLAGYIEHMNRYSSLAAQESAAPSFLLHVVLNPIATFVYNYLLRLGFLDGREGLLLHLYHSCYVSWKYAKAWERARPPRPERL